MRHRPPRSKWRCILFLRCLEFRCPVSGAAPPPTTQNLEIAKVVGHRFKFHDGLQFLCQWHDYSIEDSTYRNGSTFIHPAARLLVAKYIRDLGDKLPKDLEDWATQHPWSLDSTGRFSRSTDVPPVVAQLYGRRRADLRDPPPPTAYQLALQPRRPMSHVPPPRRPRFTRDRNLPCGCDFHIAGLASGREGRMCFANRRFFKQGRM